MKFIYLVFFTALTLIFLPILLNNAGAAGDGNAPTTTHALVGTVGLNNWYTSNVTVTLTCTDTGNSASGCKETYYCIELNNGPSCNPLLSSSGGITSTSNPTVFTVSQDSQNGEHKIRYRSKDNSGLLENEQSKSFKIDKTAPTTTGYKAVSKSDDTGSWKEYVPPFDPNEWYSEPEIPKDNNIYFSYTCSDLNNTNKGSGCMETLACFSTDGACTPSSLTDTRLKVDQDGAFIVRYFSRDIAGNDEVIRTYSAKRDITPPTYQYKIENFNQALSKTVTIICQDSLSGCSQIRYCTSTTFSKCTPTTLYTGPATVPSTAQSFSLSVTDIAGNSDTHDQKLYIVPGQDACQVRVYKDDGSGSIVAANRQYVSSGPGNTDITLNVGESYYVESTIDSGFYDNGGESHTHKIWELDPSKTNKDGRNFYFFNTTDDVGEKDGDLLETLHGTWNPVTGQDIADNLLQDPDQSVYNSKTGPWRWKFTPAVIGETTFDVFFGNRNNYDSGGVTYKRCHRTTNIVSIINTPPGAFTLNDPVSACFPPPSPQSGDLSFDGASTRLFDLYEYKDKLYAGQERKPSTQASLMVCTPGQDNICNPLDWQNSFSLSNNAGIHSMTTFNDKLYIGLQGDANAGLGDVYYCTPTTSGAVDTCDTGDWTLAYNGSQDEINTLLAYNGKLYLGEDNSDDVWVCNPGANSTCETNEWTRYFNGSQNNILSATIFKDFLYFGQGEQDNDGDIFICDPNLANCDPTAAGTKIYDGYQTVRDLIVFNDRLYAGLGDADGNRDIIMCNPKGNDKCESSEWTKVYDSDGKKIYDIEAYGNFLFAGSRNINTQGEVIRCDSGGLNCSSGDWSISYTNPAIDGVYSLFSYKDILYAGLGKDPSDANVIILDASLYTPPSTTQQPYVTLTWTASAGANFYEIWRSDSLSLPIAANIPSTQLSFVDTNVEPGTSYSYYIYAKKNSGGEPAEAGWSESISPASCEPAPTVDLKLVIGLNEYDNPPTQQTGTVASLQWTTTNSPTSCSASSNPVNPLWAGSVGTLPTNSQPIGQLTFTEPPPSIKQFSIFCSNAGGDSPLDTISVTVNPAADPAKIQTTGGDVHSNERITP